MEGDVRVYSVRKT